jgi:ketosteroid isomerase-like protein
MCIALSLLALPAKAQQMKINNSDRNAIRSVIERQLEAFQKDDAGGAFAFATPGIQMQFKTAENFMRMVKTAYQAIYRPRSVMFEELKIVDGALTQTVLLLAPNGTLMRALYLMEKQSGYIWKINGCYLVPIEEQTM